MRKQELEQADAVRVVCGMALGGVILPAAAFIVGYVGSEHGKHASTAAAVAALIVGCLALMVTEEMFTIRSFPWKVGAPAAIMNWAMSATIVFSNGLRWPMLLGGAAVVALCVMLGVPRTLRTRIAHSVARRHRSAAV